MRANRGTETMAIIDINRKPTGRELRWFGFVLVAFFGIVGSVVYLRFESPRLAYVMWAVGVLLSLVYITLRPLRVPIYVGWMRVFFPIGWTVSHLVLIVLYYLIITPIAVVMRLVGHDPMKRRFDRNAPTYWARHRTDGDPARYTRQY